MDLLLPVNDSEENIFLGVVVRVGGALGLVGGVDNLEERRMDGGTGGFIGGSFC